MFHELIALVKTNPVFAGGMGIALVGGLLVQARALPVKLLRLLRDQFSTTLTVYTEDSTFFRHLDLWLARHPSANKSRRFGIATWHNRTTGEDEFSLTPGAGFHLLRQGWRPFLVHREVENDKSSSNGMSMHRRQTVNITTFGRSISALRQLMDEVRDVQEDHETIPVYLWNGYDYSLIERKPKRLMATVCLSADIKEKVIADVRWFLESRKWFLERGVPYRRGYMFEGPPGTGKTTFILALASMFNKALYIINPAAIDNDNVLQKAVNMAGPNFVVIEDIDSLAESESRETRERTERLGEASKAGITISGLLNAMDGLGARDGRCLFITTNHPESLDSALLRPGRVDLRAHLGLAGADEALAMFHNFFPGRDASAFQATIESLLPIAPADLQNRLLGLAEADA